MNKTPNVSIEYLILRCFKQAKLAMIYCFRAHQQGLRFQEKVHLINFYVYFILSSFIRALSQIFSGYKEKSN